MALVIKYIYQALTSESEPKDGVRYPLTGSILPIILIDLAYLSFVLKIGPKFMKNRQPFDLKNVLLVYNIVQVFYNLTVAVWGCQLLFTLFDIGCITKLPEGNPNNPIIYRLCYAYYANKFIDYLDTIFFTLRKSYKQVTLLHIYHHLLMTTSSYIYVRSYGYGGHGMVMGCLNSWVHAFMYTYYLLSALRDMKSSSLWWKKYITEIQFLQFFLVLVHSLWQLFVRTDCQYPKKWLYLSITQAFVMIGLFGNFYINTYIKPKRSKPPGPVAGEEKVAAKML